MMRAVAFGALALALYASQASAGVDVGGCGEDSRPAEVMKDRRWIDSDRTLYVIDDEGRLTQRRLDGSLVREFMDHGFTDPPHVEVSPDGRFATYQGRVRNDDAQQFWIVDLEAGTERLLFETAPWHFGLPEFSPDGRWVALNLDFDRRNTDDADEGLHLFSTSGPGHIDIGRIPRTLMPEGWRVVSPVWSKDGTELLQMGFDDANGRVFYAWSPVPDGVFERVEGSWYGSKAHFTRDGVPIPVAADSFPPSRTLRGKLSSGNWTAEIDKEQRLIVRGGESEPLHAATGSYNECEGWTLGIHAWLDDRYLIYSLDSVPYLLEATTGRQVPLFEDSKRVQDYFWMP